MGLRRPRSLVILGHPLNQKEGGMPQILLVEDTIELAGVVADALRGAAMTVTHVGDGESALAFLENQPVDLVILDWMLPGMDGLAVLQALRRRVATPVLMLTARSDELDRVMGLELGADDYLTKPFSLRELVARVKALLRRMEVLEGQLRADRKASDERLCHGALALDPLARQATLEGQALDLTRTEFDLLALLLRHPSRAFSRQYLLDAVWGDDVVVTDRSVDNAVLKLRKKLGGWADAIETVWGVGYRLRREE